MKTDEWRVQNGSALRYHEPTHCQAAEAMKQVQNQTGTLDRESDGEKRDRRQKEFCATLIDKWVAVDEPTESE